MGFQHPGGDGLECSGRGLGKEFFEFKAILVFYIDLIGLIPVFILNLNLACGLLVGDQGVRGLAWFLANCHGKAAQILEHIVVIQEAVDIGGAGVYCHIHLGNLDISSA